MLELFQLFSWGVGIDFEMPVDEVHGRIGGHAEGAALVDIGLRLSLQGAHLDALRAASCA